MPTTNENVRKVDEAIAELQQATVPVAHQVFDVVHKSVAQIGSAVQLMDSNVDRISSAAANYAHAQAELTASTVDSTKYRRGARRRTAATKK